MVRREPKGHGAVLAGAETPFASGFMNPGGFFGAWRGGFAVAATGSYAWMWYADSALGSAGAPANLPIEEAPLALSIACA
jgi:hypothetical protein